MHYKDGTEVKLGDVFKKTEAGPTPNDPIVTIIGQVIVKYPTTDTCNIGFAPIVQINYIAGGERALVPCVYTGSHWSATASACEKIA